MHSAAGQRERRLRSKRVLIDEKNEPLISYYLFKQGSDNRPERERMKRVLNRAIRHELTERQRTCITMYYLEGIKMKDIAVMLGLSKSTVSRHISTATRKLRRIASYYERLPE